MDNEYDVLIVGASLAGASAAIELGKRRLKVALIDQAAFPRRKPCGEGLSFLGMVQLERLGIRDRVLELPHMKYAGYDIVLGRSRKFVRSPYSGGITVQRYELDSAVLRCALEFQSVTPLLSSKVSGIDGTDVYLSGRKLSGKKLVLACGANSALLTRIPSTTKRFGPSRTGASALYKGEFQKPLDRITIILKPAYEIYCTPLADGYLNISVLTRRDARMNVHSIFRDKELMNDVFQHCGFVGIQSGSILGRTNIGNVKRECRVANLFLAGDAKEEFDPVGGMGMSHALSSGIQTAHQILEQFSRDFCHATSHKKQEKITSAMRRFTQLTYGTLIGAKHFPPILSLSASALGEKCLKLLLSDCT